MISYLDRLSSFPVNGQCVVGNTVSLASLTSQAVTWKSCLLSPCMFSVSLELKSHQAASCNGWLPGKLSSFPMYGHYVARSSVSSQDILLLAITQDKLSGFPCIITMWSEVSCLVAFHQTDTQMYGCCVAGSRAL